MGSHESMTVECNIYANGHVWLTEFRCLCQGGLIFMHALGPQDLVSCFVTGEGLQDVRFITDRSLLGER